MSEGLAVAEEEKKRLRLEKWKHKQEEKKRQNAPKKVSLSLAAAAAAVTTTTAAHKANAKRPPPPPPPRIMTRPLAFFDDADDEQENSETDESFARKKQRPPLRMEELHWNDSDNPATRTVARFSDEPDKKRSRWDKGDDNKTKKKKSKRWDQNNETAAAPPLPESGGGVGVVDALDVFMDKLQAGQWGRVQQDALDIDTSGSMLRLQLSKGSKLLVSGGVITADELNGGNNGAEDSEEAHYQPQDWASDAVDTDDEEREEEGRRAFIEALKSAPTPAQVAIEVEVPRPAQLVVEVKNEKSRREQQLKDLERQADLARRSAEAAPDLGRLYNDSESGVMEEAERNLEAAQAAPDALQIVAELNKKKELGAVNHGEIDYITFTKNLYRVPRSLANLTHDEVLNRRAKLAIRVRGHGAPSPVATFAECGLSDKILQVLENQSILEPYAIQAQCLPCILAGRDVIGIAKTGSGKTLAYLLPLLRHILAQPPLASNESGPIGLILAPARELAFQIHSVCKVFGKALGLKSTAVYGGAGVAEQIADLKRGTEIVVATPGRLIDILTMQAGKILSLQRVTYVVMDEADRMLDMGFQPQISAVLAAVRPDRQTVLFSATFPKAIEMLARKSLKYPVEVLVGGRSIASDSVTQYAELVEEEDKFLRLLQILGEQVEGSKKVLVFVDTQVRCDGLFEQLLRSGYSSLSLHGGKEQEDRDSTISDFKRKDGPNVLVATGVAGRGLDVPDCCCVVNFSAPNHLEAYVHQVGRTGRAGNKGVAYTFVNSVEEAKHAPTVVRALSEAGHAENVSPELKTLSDEYKSKVEKGEARFAGSGFKGKGYTYDSTELNEAQRIARIEKRQALIEAGLVDPDEEDPFDSEAPGVKKSDDADEKKIQAKKDAMDQIKIPENLTPELLALPGMKEALLRKAGIVPTESIAITENDPSLGYPVKQGDNHWIQEFEINDYPREARWKVTQRDTTSRLQDEFRTAVTLKGTYFEPGKEPGPGERRLYLVLEANSENILKKTVAEVQRLLNEETLRVGAKTGGVTSHKYNVFN